MVRSVRYGLATLALVGAAQPVMALEVMPHRALYVMSLESAKPSSGVINATGTLGYEWGETCDGWTIEQRYDLSMQYEDDKPAKIGSSFVTWESKNGLSYRFNERKTRNGQLEEEIRGEATMKPNGGAGKANFNKPKEQSFDLPPGSYFPTAHTLMLIHKAEAGEHYVPAQVFDGSEFDGPVLVGTVIGNSIDKTLIAAGVKSPLVTRQGWPMRLAFFPDSSKSERPDYELAMRLLDNGVSSEMTIDYGDYVVKAALQKIESLPHPAC
ncbi:MAG TPA: cell envelope integrity EipB family protein [Aliidongia sp.]|nr:cell envelope integrity EipB family protein [Aliidongia sp.]